MVELFEQDIKTVKAKTFCEDFDEQLEAADLLLI